MAAVSTRACCIAEQKRQVQEASTLRHQTAAKLKPCKAERIALERNAVVNSAEEGPHFDWAALATRTLQPQHAACFPVGARGQPPLAVLMLVRGQVSNPFSAVTVMSATVTAFSIGEVACARHFCQAIASCHQKLQLRSQLEAAAPSFSMAGLVGSDLRSTLQRCSSAITKVVPCDEVLISCLETLQVRTIRIIWAELLYCCACVCQLPVVLVVIVCAATRGRPVEAKART